MISFILKERFAMNIFLRAICFTLVLTGFVCAEEGFWKETKPHVNIIGWRNGVGLNKDYDILIGQLSKLGYTVEFRDLRNREDVKKIALNIFSDYVDEYFFQFADHNYLIPNPEWSEWTPEQLAKFDKIICKTREGERIFKQFNPNTVYMGFTSMDRYDPAVTKNYHAFLHLAGASIQKGSAPLIESWVAHPEWPQMFVIRHEGDKKDPNVANIKLVFQYLPDHAIVAMENAIGIHLCPSETEGFGHYINEAMSCESVVITTDAPPMNEFITDKRFLVGYHTTAPWRLATRYFVDKEKLNEVISNLLKMPEQELQKIGKKNRETFLENDRQFKARFAEIFNPDRLTVAQGKASSTTLTPSGSIKKKINIVSDKNGVGLSQDIDVLYEELTRLGHEVAFVPDNLGVGSPADINIFNDPRSLFQFPFANKNILIPNPEWCFFTPQEIAKFDMILCKTKEAERIFKTLNSHAVYMGFTCKDRFLSDVKKDYRSPLHLVGKSMQKGTDQVVKSWIKNPQWPQLTLVKTDVSAYPSAQNILYRFGYLPIEEVKELQNKHGIHICPSETEGFGHYIVEAMSCGAVVVTTDGPPMNELVLDKRCLVGAERTEPRQFATNYYVDPKKLDQTITQLLSLSDAELKEIGAKNRQWFLENDRKFKQRLAEIFSDDFVLPARDPIEEAFTTVCTRRLWGGNPSGEGSTPENTVLYRFFLQNFLKDHNIQTVTEVGSGDWGFSKMIDWSGIQYTGYDICKELVETNQKEFGSSTIKFIHGNALRLDLPHADLLICKDVLQHLPNYEIYVIFPQLKKFKHVLLINDVDAETLTSDNRDMFAGGFRPIDLTKPPFNLKAQKLLTFICGTSTKQVLYIRNE